MFGWCALPGSARPPVAARIVSEIEALAASMRLSVRQIRKEIAGKASRGVIGEITKRVRAGLPPAFIDPAFIDQNIKPGTHRRKSGLFAPQDSRQ
jgi:hypothetical protein